MNQLNLDFIKDWNNITQEENKTFELLKQGLEIISNSIEEKHILSIYLKGSFVRREMNKDSDVDVAVIVNNDDSLKLLKNLHLKYRKSNILNFEFSGYSIEELKTGKLSQAGKSKRTGPGRFTRLIPSYILIYGDQLEVKELSMKKDIEYLKNVIGFFERMFIPNYEKKELKVEDYIKQLLWLVELEIAVKNNHFTFTSWNDLKIYCEEDHIIHKLLYCRSNITCINQKDKDTFFKESIEYINELKEEFL